MVDKVFLPKSSFADWLHENKIFNLWQLQKKILDETGPSFFIYLKIYHNIKRIHSQTVFKAQSFTALQ